MNLRSLGLLGLAAVALLALWMLLAGPEQIRGLDTGKTGFALLVATAWGSLYALYRLPRGEFERNISPGEWRAWIGAVFMAQLTAYVLLQTHHFDVASLLDSPDAHSVGRHVVMLIIAWVVVDRVMAMRWKGQVQEDERDREISRIAGSWGAGALTFCVIGIAVMLALSPAEKLEWASPLMIAHMLVFSLLWGGLIYYAATAIQYWRDRR